MEPFSLTSTARTYPTTIPYEEIKKRILGVRYQLSLSFVGATRAQQLNETYRHKTYTPNVLSFPLMPDTGEIFICPTVAKREAPKYELPYTQYVGFLFIHGCLHLKGHDHGATMERLEQKYMEIFFGDTKHTHA